jgi:hypothetical protein
MAGKALGNPSVDFVFGGVEEVGGVQVTGKTPRDLVPSALGRPPTLHPNRSLTGSLALSLM